MPFTTLPCSAGVGRTGTFIAIDAMMQRMKERDEISIYEYLHEMRNCRMYLVMNVVCWWGAEWMCAGLYICSE